jgi:lysophospholipase L1-like esterase
MLANGVLRVVSSGLCSIVLLASAFAIVNIGSGSPKGDDSSRRWIGTWATAAQPEIPGQEQTFHNQTVRLVVHISAGGQKVRIRVSNTFGNQPLHVGAAHIARRASAADIDPSSDRPLTFSGRASAIVPAGSMLISDPVDLNVPALSDLAVSLFFPENAVATTSHVLAQQISYVSAETGDATAARKFPAPKEIDTWPFLTGVDVEASPSGATIVAFGSSTTDGDGSTENTNHRWPDVLAERLQKAAGGTELGVLNEGIIGNRLLADSHSPRQAGGPFSDVLAKFGDALGSSGLARFERDVLDQAGVKYVILALGVNDLLFPGSFTPASESVSAQQVIEGNRQLIQRAHEKGIRVILTTIPPFEGAAFKHPVIYFSTPEKEATRQQVNAWIRSSKEFDGVIDFDEVLRDTSHPSRLLPAYDSSDHLHCNDAGYIASANAIPLSLFGVR